MGLNDIRLSPSLVASLYQHSLLDEQQAISPAKVETRPPDIIEKPDTTPTWKFLGDNKKQTLLLVNYPSVVHLPDEELDFLSKMLLACQLSISDVAILNTHHHSMATYKDLLSFFKSRTVLLFGITPGELQLPIDFPQYQVQALAGTTFLHTPALETRHTDSLLKSKLWVSLKKIFNIA